MASVNLIIDKAQVSEVMAAAMQRGLEAVAQPGARVVVTGDFVGTVERLDATSGPYDAERGVGVVAAKTLQTQEGSSIVVNADVVMDRSPADVERLLAHEGGHVTLHEDGQSVAPRDLLGRHSDGVAFLYGTATVAVEEFRIERRLAELGYPQAEQTLVAALDDQLFLLSCEIFEALWDEASADVRIFASAVLGSMQRVTITLGYLAGPIVAGANSAAVQELSDFGQQAWAELLSRSWHDRLQLYQQIPPVGSPYPASDAAAHIQQAACVERTLLHDLGFAIEGGTQAGDDWSFLRTAPDSTFNERWKRLEVEGGRRGGFGAG